MNEKDWKLLRKLLPDWQERYMEGLIKEYIELLSSDEIASTKFWELEKRIKHDKKDTGVVVSGMSRSNMDIVIMNLLSEGAITLLDLKDFSDELKERAIVFCASCGRRNR